MPDVVGSIGMKLILDNTQFRQSLVSAQKDADASSAKMSGAFKKVGAAIAGAFSAAAIIKFGKESVESAAKVQASNAQLEQTFGSLQGKAEAAMKNGHGFRRGARHDAGSAAGYGGQRGIL